MTDQQLRNLRAAGQVAAQLHQKIANAIKPGLNLLEIEQIAKDFIEKAGMEPAFLGYKGYRYVTCLSVNDEIVHGLPRDYPLVAGDVIAVDLGVKNEGMMVDTARTHAVGAVTPPLANLLAVTAQALIEVIPLCRAGATTGDIGAQIEKVVKNGSCAVIRELTGHGVGPTLQEPPSIPNYGRPGSGAVLEKGMVIAVEPITCLEKTSIGILSDGWTIISSSGSPSAHFEDTLLITDSDPVVLTQLA